jgi:hypothetical protein
LAGTEPPPLDIPAEPLEPPALPPAPPPAPPPPSANTTAGMATAANKASVVSFMRFSKDCSPRMANRTLQSTFQTFDFGLERVRQPFLNLNFAFSPHEAQTNVCCMKSGSTGSGSIMLMVMTPPHLAQVVVASVF